MWVIKVDVEDGMYLEAAWQNGPEYLATYTNDPFYMMDFYTEELAEAKIKAIKEKGITGEFIAVEKPNHV